jgi:hypothetical protein
MPMPLSLKTLPTMYLTFSMVRGKRQWEETACADSTYPQAGHLPLIVLNSTKQLIHNK